MSESRTTDPKDLDVSTNRKLLLALKRVNDSWFPPNPQLIEKIQSELNTGTYDENVDALTAEIKNDFALFSYCLKQLTTVFRKEGIKIAFNATPHEIFRKAGITRLKQVLSTDLEGISNHSLNQGNASQTGRLKEAMISASTAEILSIKSNINPEIGFCSGLLRQLGLTLVAWNYPSVYRRTLTSLKKGMSLDVALTRQLGFSPSLLGISIAREWGLSDEIRSSLGDFEAGKGMPADRALALKTVSSNLSKICEIGEALARANDPEHYPDAKSDWDGAKKEIESRLGGQGLALIQAHIRKQCQAYVKALPHTFKPALELRATIESETAHPSELLDRNRYVKECSPALQAEFRLLYTKIDPQLISKDNIITLVRRIVPRAGFKRGCIFLLDPNSITLVPRLAIGDGNLNQFDAIPCENTAPGTNPVLAAFRCNAPIIEQEATMDGGKVAYIASVIGITQRTGVLYLEIAEEILADFNSKPMAYFKAVLHALQDCLNVK